MYTGWIVCLLISAAFVILPLQRGRGGGVEMVAEIKMDARMMAAPHDEVGNGGS